MKLVFLFLFAFLSSNIYANTNMQPTQIAYNSFYVKQSDMIHSVSSEQVRSDLSCYANEGQNIFDKFLSNNEYDDEKKSFFGVDLDYIKFGVSLFSLGLDFIPVE